MRNDEQQLEKEFFEILEPYINLERNTGRAYSAAEYSLAGVKELADLVENPETDLDVIHIAGTKGKGSVAYFLTGLLTSAGYSCGTFTSPHLATVRERFLVNNDLVSYSMLLENAYYLKEKVEKKHLKPTFFEFLTVLSLMIFRDAGCRYAVLETGIGGLLDSTNYIEGPECCVITAVSYDHTALLGDSIEDIAEQKAGIIKYGVPVVCGPQPYPDVSDIVQETAKSKSASFYEVDPEEIFKVDHWLPPKTADFLRENFLTALKTCEVLGIKPSQDTFTLKLPPGRCECIKENPLIIIDAAHNADSARRLGQALGMLYPQSEFTVVLGVVGGKDAEGILLELGKWAQRFIFTNPRPFKGSQLDTLIKLGDKHRLNYSVIPEIQRTSQLPPDENLVFAGSFFTAVIGRELFS